VTIEHIVDAFAVFCENYGRTHSHDACLGGSMLAVMLKDRGAVVANPKAAPMGWCWAAGH